MTAGRFPGLRRPASRSQNWKAWRCLSTLRRWRTGGTRVSGQSRATSDCAAAAYRSSATVLPTDFRQKVSHLLLESKQPNKSRERPARVVELRCWAVVRTLKPSSQNRP